MSEWPKALPSHITHSLTHMQGSTNKDLFVCLRNVFRIRRCKLWFEGAYDQFQFIMQISVATIVLKPPWYNYWIIICSLDLFISFCSLSRNSVFVFFIHPLHQLSLNKGLTWKHTHTDKFVISSDDCNVKLLWTQKCPFLDFSLGHNWYQVLLARERECKHSYYFHRCTSVPAAGSNLSRMSVLANRPNRWQRRCHSSVSSLSWALSGLILSTVTLQTYTGAPTFWTQLIWAVKLPEWWNGLLSS